MKAIKFKIPTNWHISSYELTNLLHNSSDLYRMYFDDKDLFQDYFNLTKKTIIKNIKKVDIDLKERIYGKDNYDKIKIEAEYSKMLDMYIPTTFIENIFLDEDFDDETIYICESNYIGGNIIKHKNNPMSLRCTIHCDNDYTRTLSDAIGIVLNEFSKNELNILTEMEIDIFKQKVLKLMISIEQLRGTERYIIDYITTGLKIEKNDINHIFNNADNSENVIITDICGWVHSFIL